MNDTIINVGTLPPTLKRRFRSKRVYVREDNNGSVILTPCTSTKPPDLWGLLPDGKFTTEKYLEQKKADKELEA